MHVLIEQQIRRIGRLLLLGVSLAPLSLASDAFAQQSPGCLGGGPEADALVSYVQRLVTEDSEAIRTTRARYHLVLGSAEQVTLVTDDQLCRRAARTYSHRLDDRGRLDRAVWVVYIDGERDDQRYVVLDPSELVGEFQLHMVFDRTFKLLAQFAG